MKICQLLELIRSIPNLTKNLIRENTSAMMFVEGTHLGSLKIRWMYIVSSWHNNVHPSPVT